MPITSTTTKRFEHLISFYANSCPLTFRHNGERSGAEGATTARPKGCYWAGSGVPVNGEEDNTRSSYVGIATVLGTVPCAASVGWAGGLAPIQPAMVHGGMSKSNSGVCLVFSVFRVQLSRLAASGA